TSVSRPAPQTGGWERRRYPAIPGRATGGPTCVWLADAGGIIHAAASCPKPHARMQNAQLARLFDEMADLLEIQGANAFRVRAYRNATRTIESLSGSVQAIAVGGVEALTELDGIGKDLAQKIIAALQTG